MPVPFFSLFCFSRAALLHEHFAEQDVRNLCRGRGHVDPPEELFAQPGQPCGSAQVLDPQFPEIDLEVVDDARQDGLDPLDVVVLFELQTYADLEIVALASGTVEVHQKIRKIEKDHRAHPFRLNGLTGLAITKLDILDGLESLKICTAYDYNGTIIDDFPGNLKG